MSIVFNAMIQWISPEVGGRKVVPQEGTRFNIIWLKNIADFSKKTLWTVQLKKNESVEGKNLHDVQLEFSFSDDPTFSSKEIVDGNLFELVDGYRIVGIGKVNSN